MNHLVLKTAILKTATIGIVLLLLALALVLMTEPNSPREDSPMQIAPRTMSA